ncbi:MAG: penicillin acylase family protein [Ilumatobacteraceae bacterium]
MVRRVAVVVVAASLVVACTPRRQGETENTVDTSPATTVEEGSYYEATIRRTTDGVPHILAGDLKGAFFGQGYASAQDHGCSLADQLIRIEGRRAEFLGAGENNKYLDSDFAWRSIGIDEIARADYESADPKVVEQFEAFAAGWNQFLDDNTDLTGWCAGEPWVFKVSGADVYSYARAIALTASSAQLVSYIAAATPPELSSDTTVPTTEASDSTSTTSAAAAFDSFTDQPIASNGWAIGADRTTGGQGGLLLANPHFPWEGELRFWEVQLTVPGELDIYGAQLLGLPGVGIGFTDSFAWTHTVSAGNRFTAYTLTLDPADPTSYLVDGQSRPMTSTFVDVNVLQPDGSTAIVQREMWRSEYGPIIDFPGVGWTSSSVLTYRDANIDNDEFIEQYAAMDLADSLDEFIDAHRTFQGVPLFNTIAVGADGRAWYADTSATPNLSDAAEAAYLESIDAGGLAAVAAQSRVVLLDGSNSLFQWQDDPDARDPGVVPFESMPMTERTDYVFNANDSYWLSNADHLLDGDYSVLHGRAGIEQSWRTRQNASVLADTSASGPAGADGTFTADELRDLALDNEGYVARALREPVVERCSSADFVRVPDLTDAEGDVLVAAESVNVEYACSVLASWDGRYDTDSVGAVLWREFIGRTDISSLWDVPFDAADPVNTPSGLAPFVSDTTVPVDDLTADPVLVGLARAVQVLNMAGRNVDVPLGDLQFTERSGARIAIHGGFGSDGVTNVVSWSSSNNSTEPQPTRADRIIDGSQLTRDGYPINYGTSFVMVVDFSSGAPVAWSLLTYGETGDRTSELFEVQTVRFSEKDWKPVLFIESDIAADPDVTSVEVSGDQ